MSILRYHIELNPVHIQLVDVLVDTNHHQWDPAPLHLNTIDWGIVNHFEPSSRNPRRELEQIRGKPDSLVLLH